MTGCAGGDGPIPPMPTCGRSGKLGRRSKDKLEAALAAGRFRFGLLTRITLKDGEEIDLWSARDALALKALAIVLAKHAPVSPRCTHVKGHGGAKAAVRQVMRHLRYGGVCANRPHNVHEGRE